LTSVDYEKISNTKLSVAFNFKQHVEAAPKSFMLNDKDGKKLIFDFSNTDHILGSNTVAINKSGIKDIKAVTSSNKGSNRLRLIVSVRGPHTYDVKLDEKQVKIAFLSSAKAKSRGTQKKVKLLNVEFKKFKQKNPRVELSFTGSKLDLVIGQNKRELLINLRNVSIPKRLLKNLDVTQSKTLVQAVELIQEKYMAVVKIKTNKPYEYFSFQIKNKLIVDLKPVKRYKKGKAKYSNQYAGRRISLNFQKIEVKALLQLLAEFTGKNIVIAETVKGDISLRLNSVPWDEAMAIVLKTQGLAKRTIGDIILIAPSAEIISRENQELQRLKQTEELQTLYSDIIQINYAKATNIAKLLKAKHNSLLSERGQVSVDKRTNVLLIKDVRERIVDVKKLVKKLDIPVKQVLIETRIVDVNDDFERDLGIKFGITSPINVSGTLAGANALAGGTAPSAIVPISNRLNVDLPAVATIAGQGGVGIALARLGKGIFLDLELKALESEKKGTIISTPHLITMDRKKAIIESGEEIPYNQSTSSGAASIAFKKAVLKLEVTPHITPNRRIILTIAINNDSPNRTVPGTVSINTKSIRTQVLVNNGETIVLGGVYKETDTNTIFRVPFLGRIPLLGRLFSSEFKEKKRSELLIFITPKILDGDL